MNAKTYVSLPGRRGGLLGVSRLWLGSDHVLSVQSTGYSENYKRFFFADIQAIVVTKTHTGKIWNGVYAFFAVVFLLLSVPLGFDPAAVGLWVIGGTFLIALIVNTLLGPTCICQVRTAVQTERFSALGRLRTARRVIERLRPMVIAAQGEIAPDQLAAALDQHQTPAGPHPGMIG